MERATSTTLLNDEYEINYSTSDSINKLVPARQRQRREREREREREITAGANGVGSPVTVKTAADCSFVELYPTIVR